MDGRSARRGSFAEFYLERVALGDGCNCGELTVRRRARPERLADLWQALGERLRALRGGGTARGTPGPR